MPWLLLPLAAMGLIAAGIAVESFWSEFSWFRSHHRPVDAAIEQAGIAGLRPVSIEQSGGGRLRGWFRAGANGATVVLLHGSGADRRAVLPEAQVLARDGFGVLLFDWPGHGESTGAINYGKSELRALDAVLDWLLARPDVDRDRIGMFGFSLGGFILSQFALRDSRVSAFVIAAAPRDLLEHTIWFNRRWGPLSQWPALLADYLGGVRPALRAADAIEASATSQRASLVIAGRADPVVPLRMVRALFEEVVGPKEFWIVPTDRHGDFVATDPVEYPRRLSAFFRDRLRVE